MSSKKLIVVLGATGNQGGSVVNTYLEQPQWKVRGLTRNTNSDKAKVLAERGVEVVTADLDDKSSLESAFAGAHAIFIVSDYWGTFGALASTAKPEEIDSLYLKVAEIEKQQLVNALDTAAHVPSLERLVLSSLQNASKWSGGKYKHVYHFEFKARAAEYAAEAYPELWAKTSIFQAGWFTSNYVSNPMSLPRNVSRRSPSILPRHSNHLSFTGQRHHPVLQQPRQRPEDALHRRRRGYRPSRESSHRIPAW